MAKQIEGVSEKIIAAAKQEFLEKKSLTEPLHKKEQEVS